MSAHPRRTFDAEIVPLSHRATALSCVRVAVVLAVLWIGALDGALSPDVSLTAAGYLALASLLAGAVIWIRHRPSTVIGFGLMLCLDGIAVLYGQALLGPGWGTDVVQSVFLTAVCLLGSFRTGLKMAIWQSLLLALYVRGSQSGLFATDVERGDRQLLSELIMLWLLVIVVCTAAAISERELRRRRYDAEALQHFATILHHEDLPAGVIQRTLDYVVHELDASRTLVCQAANPGLRLLNGEADPNATSALLDLADRPGRTGRVLRLDPARDRWLAQQLPADARRLIALTLSHSPDLGRVWIVFQHRGRSTTVERRVIAAAGQVGAIAGLALSRAQLLQSSLTSAATDGLTGLPNRRAFDQLAARLGAPQAPRYAVILVDIDHFKAVNDTYGHQSGDDVLRAVAAALQSAAPPESLVARYGGEEFVVMMLQATEEMALDAAEQLRLSVQRADGPTPVTASFGVAAGPGGEPTASVIAAADAALYRAKAEGRNRVLGTHHTAPDADRPGPDHAARPGPPAPTMLVSRGTSPRDQ